ncbi:hypothetical protein OG414_31670 [Streptomyces sp. NBC_01174]|nr:hypothetical protein OG414_31670 [Streptomyces sp. NBC_01174]
MKRIHFTAEDLARTRVVATIGVAAETMDSVRRLRERDGGLAFRSWRASVGTEFDERLGEQARTLLALMPASGPQIDVASLTGDVTRIDEAVDRLLAAPRSLMRAELEYIDVHPDHRSWAGALADGDREARLQLERWDGSSAGYVTAPSTAAGRKGFLITGSTVTGDVSASSFHLGRPWHAGGDATLDPMATFRNSTLGAAVKSAPWTDMSGFSWKDDRFAEYKNTGPGSGAASSDRPQLTDAQAADQETADWLAGWTPSAS